MATQRRSHLPGRNGENIAPILLISNFHPAFRQSEPRRFDSHLYEQVCPLLFIDHRISFSGMWIGLCCFFLLLSSICPFLTKNYPKSAIWLSLFKGDPIFYKAITFEIPYLAPNSVQWSQRKLKISLSLLSQPRSPHKFSRLKYFPLLVKSTDLSPDNISQGHRMTSGINIASRAITSHLSQLPILTPEFPPNFIS